jgi:hypothetical protein
MQHVSNFLQVGNLHARTQRIIFDPVYHLFFFIWEDFRFVNRFLRRCLTTPEPVLDKWQKFRWAAVTDNNNM